MLVFREGRRLVAGPPLCSSLISELIRWDGASSEEVLLRLLLQSGELECSLADAGSRVVPAIERTSDAVADALVRGVPLHIHPSSLVDDADVPVRLTVCRPEGFAYYALNPLNYADAVHSMSLGGNVAVIGIRSIGTTLSAVVAAAARKRGVTANRITVRPEGQAWDRKLKLGHEQRQWIEEHVRRTAHFLVVDEGPGLSGSSFLAVGEALGGAGVPLQDMVFLCSAEPDVSALRAPDAASRWRKFRVCAVRPPWRIPHGAGQYFAEGRWRESLAGDWPGSWILLERLKYVNGVSLLKFEGLGAYGSCVLGRAQMLAAAGFSPTADPAGGGFVRYEWLQGRMPRQISRAILDRIAEYCAWRSREFVGSEPTNLGQMLASNWLAAFGSGNDVPKGLPLECAVIPDGKMQPYEWLETDKGLLKLDSVDHGDDHFYPGPTDIAWDLAGAIIEWSLDSQASEYLLARYAQLSGDAPHSRIAQYLLAYALFRYAYCRLAAESLRGTEEEMRLVRDAERYRAAAHLHARVPVAA